MDQTILKSLAAEGTKVIEVSKDQSFLTWKNESVKNRQLLDLLAFIESEREELSSYKSYNIPKVPTASKSVRKYYILASIFALLAIVLLVSKFASDKSSSQYQVAFLEDDSEVYLFDGASITSSNDFNETNRIVSLSGSAFFDINHDIEKPFIINHDLGKIEVLGTSFLVQENEEGIFVSVKDGTVKLIHNNSASVILNAGDAFQYNQNELIVSTKVKPYNFLFSGAFVNEDIKSILLELAKVHDMGIYMDNSFIESTCLYNGVFDNASVQEVLHEFQILFNLKYNVLNEEIQILSSECN